MSWRFTAEAQRVVLFAQEETQRLENPAVEPSHILLGLLRSEDDSARKILSSLKIPSEKWLRALRKHKGGTQRAPGAEISFSHSAKGVLERAVETAKKLGDGYVGTEHLLVGVAAALESDPQAAGAGLLRRAGIGTDSILEEVRRLRGPSLPSMESGEPEGRTPVGGMDSITLSGVACRVRIGVPDRERKTPQKILIDIALRLDLRKAGRTDDVKDTVDYAALERGVRALAETGEVHLLEHLAEAVAGLMLQSDRRIRSARVTVHKKPKTMPKAADVAVEVYRIAE